MPPEKRSWSSRMTQPGQSTNLLSSRDERLSCFALDQFNLPVKRYSFAHAKTARRPSCCGCVAWGSGHLPATLLAKGWEKCKVQSEAKTTVLKSSLMMRWARAQSQQRKWPQLTHGLRHGLPVSGRSSENSENEAPSNADRSELRERRKHLVAKSVLFGPNLRL